MKLKLKIASGNNSVNKMRLPWSNTRLIYIAGQSGTDATEKIVSEDTADQMRQSFENLCIALDQVGAKPEDVAKITVLIVNHNEALLKTFRGGN